MFPVLTCIHDARLFACCLLCIARCVPLFRHRRFVVLVSDANIEQYGITPAEISKLLRHQASVRVFVIFIGTLEGQAEKYIGAGASALPPGHVFLCLNTRDLPKVLQVRLLLAGALVIATKITVPNCTPLPHPNHVVCLPVPALLSAYLQALYCSFC